jgi:DNA-binding beta-propeller fold protein YncE
VAVEQGTSLLFQSCDGSFQSNFYIQSWIVDQATGNILSVNGFGESQGGGLATGLTVDPSGKWLAVTDIFNNNVHVLAIDPTNAGLTESPDLIFPTGTAPNLAAFDNTGKFLYVLNGGLGWVGPGSNNISAYAFNASTGMLTPLPGSPYTTGQSPTSFVIAQP